MTSLDLGALVGRVVLETTTFDRAYQRVVRQFATIGEIAGKSAAGTAKLDQGLAATGASADKAATGIERAGRASTTAAAAEEKAARAAAQHAAALDRVGGVMSAVTTDAQRMQQVQLRVIAAQDRLNQVMSSGTASTRQLAAAQAGLIGAERAQFRAQEQIAGKMSTLTGSMDRQAASAARLETLMASLAGASAKERQAALGAFAAQERLTVAQEGGVASARQLASAQAAVIASQQRVAAVKGPGFLGGTAKMAAEFGLLIGVVEGVKKAIDITKQANDFQRAMVQVQTNADVTAGEVRKASGALLDMAGPVAAAPNELAVAWYHAKSVGLDYAKSIETTRIAAEGARVGHADLEQTMNALTSTVASNIPGVESMSKAMGQLIAIVGTGDMKLSDLNQALGSGILTVVKGYGLSLTDVGAALATFGDNNIRGADAATMLRMAVQSMAVPARAGRDRLHELGLATDTLAKDMQTGGLNKAILDLKSHLDRAGVSSVQVGAILTEIFGKRAGPGLAVLVGQVDRLESKFKILGDSGANFDQKWKATQQTAAFALASLGHQAEAAGIKLTQKLGPGIAAAANALSHDIPAAISTAQTVLGPFEHMVGTGLVIAWHAATMAARVAATTLGAVGDAAVAMRGPITDLGTFALVAFAAFKGATLAVAALRAIQTAATLTAVRILEIRAAIAAVMAGEAAMSGGAFVAGLAAFAVATYAAGKGLSQLTDSGHVTVDTFNALTGSLGGLNSAMVNAGGHAQQAASDWLKAKIASTGLDVAVGKANVTVTDLMTAIQGGPKAFAPLFRALQSSGQLSDKAATELVTLAAGYTQTSSAAKNMTPAVAAAVHSLSAHSAAAKADATALQWNVDAHGNLVLSTVKAGSALDNTSAAMAHQTMVSTMLKNALDALNGVNETVEQTTDAFSISLGQLRDKSSLARDAHGHLTASLRQNTVAGAQNRQMLVGVIDAAKAQAQATADQARKNHTVATSLRIGNAALKANEDRIRKAAAAAGMNKGEVDKLIGSLGKLSAVHANPKIDAKTQPALTAVQRLQARINAIRQGHVPGLDANSAPALGVIADLQARINALQGKQVSISIDTYNRTHAVKVAASGGFITGPGSGTSDSIPARLSNGEFVVRAAQTAKHRSLLEDINRGGNGYANGGVVTSITGGGGPIRRSGKDWVYGGIRYASERAAENAQTRAGHVENLNAGIRYSGVSGLAHVIQGQKGPAAAAMRDLARAVEKAFTLKGIESKIAATRALIGKMTSFRSGVEGTLTGQFDLGTSGSVSDFVAGLGGQAGQNKTFTAEINRLRHAHLNKSLLSQLIAKGPNATLDTLAHGSTADIANANKAYAGYASSVRLAGNAAVYQQFGHTVAGESAYEKQLARRQATQVQSIDKLLLAITKLTGRPAQVVVDGKVIGHTVVEPTVIRLLDELGNHYAYGRKH